MKNIKYIVSSTKKFKTSRVTFKFDLPIKKEYTADGSVLSDLMTLSCEKYDTIKKLNKELYSLYDMRLVSNVSQKGILYIFEISFNFICDSYLPNDITNSVTEFIKEIILNPNFENETYIENIKNKRILEVKSAYDDKMYYAFKSLQNVMDKEEQAIVNINSTEEGISNVNKDSLKSFYSKLISDANLTILIDSVDNTVLQNTLEKYFKSTLKREYQTYNVVHNEFNDEEFKSETQSLSQSKFAIGIRLDLSSEDFKKFTVFNSLFGGYSFSRLFTNIREKQSLAYTIASSYNPMLNIMYIYGGISNGTGTDYESVEQVLKSIKSELESICSGNLSDVELLQAKSMIKNSLYSALDSQTAMQDIQYSLYLNDKQFDADEYIEEIESITKEDIIEIANRVKFDTIFLLRGDK